MGSSLILPSTILLSPANTIAAQFSIHANIRHHHRRRSVLPSPLPVLPFSLSSQPADTHTNTHAHAYTQAAPPASSRLTSASPPPPSPAPSILVIESGPPTTKDDPLHTQPARYFHHLRPDSRTIHFHVARPSEALRGRAPVVPCGRCVGGGSSVNCECFSA